MSGAEKLALNGQAECGGCLWAGCESGW